MRRAVLWDSSAILALLDGTDAFHAAAAEIADRLSTDARHSVMTNYLEVETHALLLNRLGRGTAREWLLRGGLPLIRAVPADEHRAKEILARYEDKDFSLCDAISFAVMDRLRVRTVFSFDRHFKQYGRFEVLGV